MSATTSPRLSTTEYAVLGVLAERPNHGFALSKVLAEHGDVGRVMTVRRPLVYRALDRLVDGGYAEPVATEPGAAGPKRIVHRATRSGRRRLGRWLEEPVEHVRDMRIEFLLKLTLLARSGRSAAHLISAQQAALRDTLAALDEAEPTDHVELWRRHNAAAVAGYLDALEAIHPVRE